MRRPVKKKTIKRVGIRVSPEEYERFQKQFKSTTCRTFSEFFRDVLNNKPLVVKYRNESADDFLEVAITLKNELNAIGNKFDQAVACLHLLQDQHGLKASIQNLEANVFSFQQKTDEIKMTMHQIYQSCIQK